MKALFLGIVILAGSITLPAFNSSADQREIVERLRNGGHILMVRHALAPGSGDPVNFKIEKYAVVIYDRGEKETVNAY